MLDLETLTSAQTTPPRISRTLAERFIAVAAVARMDPSVALLDALSRAFAAVGPSGRGFGALVDWVKRMPLTAGDIALPYPGAMSDGGPYAHPSLLYADVNDTARMLGVAPTVVANVALALQAHRDIEDRKKAGLRKLREERGELRTALRASLRPEVSLTRKSEPGRPRREEAPANLLKAAIERLSHATPAALTALRARLDLDPALCVAIAKSCLNSHCELKIGVPHMVALTDLGRAMNDGVPLPVEHLASRLLEQSYANLARKKAEQAQAASAPERLAGGGKPLPATTTAATPDFAASEPLRGAGGNEDHEDHEDHEDREDPEADLMNGV